MMTFATVANRCSLATLPTLAVVTLNCGLHSTDMHIEHANREQLPDTCRRRPAHGKLVARVRVLSPYPGALEPSRILCDLRAHAAPFNILTALYFLSSGNHSIAYVTGPAIKRRPARNTVHFHREWHSNFERKASPDKTSFHCHSSRRHGTRWQTLERALMGARRCRLPTQCNRARFAFRPICPRLSPLQPSAPMPMPTNPIKSERAGARTASACSNDTATLCHISHAAAPCRISPVQPSSHMLTRK